MTVVDFIDVIDDIIDLSSDEETAQQDHNATKPQPTDKQDVFVLAREERQDDHAAIISPGEGSQEASESGIFLVASASHSVTEKVSIDTAQLKNYPSSTTSVPLPSPTSTPPTAVGSEVGDTHLVANTSPSLMEKVPLDKAELKNCPSCPASVPLHSPASTTSKALANEDGDTKLASVKHPKKNYRTYTRRRSLRFEQKRGCCDSPLEEPAVDHKRSHMLEAAEESASSADNAESTKSLSSDSAT